MPEPNIDEDLQLTTYQKLQLIKSIEHWQRHRRERLKFWHNAPGLDRASKHLFMRKEIELLRDQKKRLLTLKQHVLQ